MSRPPALEPRWLVGLLNQWALRGLREGSHALGFSPISVMLKDGIPGRTRSYDPTGYGEADFCDIESAVQKLELMRRISVFRYFKPWMRNAIEREFPNRGNDRWMDELRSALQMLAVELGSKDKVSA